MACIMKLYIALKGSAIRHQVLLAMTFIQFGFAGMTLISKAALNDGMNPLVFNAYRQVIATFVLALLVLLMERKKSGSLPFSLFCKIFVAALLGPTLSLDLYYVALHLTSATFAAAILNSIPVVTFVLAIIMGLETVGWRSFYGGLKILGIVITVGGSMLLSFYRRPSTGQSHSPSPGSSEGTFFVNKLEGRTRSILGPVLMLLSAICWSTWLVVQSKLLELYPARLRLSTLQCLISSVQSTIIAVALEREPNSWKIRWDIKLASLAYCGVFVTGAAYGLQIWCIEKKGPFYVSMFSPLALVLTAIFSAIFWAERLNWQSILGGILIVGGLYGVLWGRNKAEKQEIHNSESQTEQSPDIEKN
ncbi:WAT1-RELATED PROTEIN [Salix purpurea]|uniref:WAT1-related protein n=1 Tax=Salix purpurea TaxID=77065 RepID=A0A9Q0WP73_SALPP|nr:WAT1-RELATED PROTEIN [Salix purpurea]